jgi:hypothetical protein
LAIEPGVQDGFDEETAWFSRSAERSLVLKSVQSAGMRRGSVSGGASRR